MNNKNFFFCEIEIEIFFWVMDKRGKFVLEIFFLSMGIEIIKNCVCLYIILKNVDKEG